MTPLGSGLLVVGLLVGGWLCRFAYAVHRPPDRLGRRALAVVAGTFGGGCVVAALAGLSPALLAVRGPGELWPLVLLVTWNLAAAPWIVFALRYTGTWPTISRRWTLALTAPVLLVPVRVGVQVSGLDVPAVVTRYAATVVFAYVLSLVVAGCYLLLRQTSGYRHLSQRQGIALSAVPIGSLLLWNLGSLAVRGPTQEGAFAGGAVVIAGGFAAARYRYDLFESMPAAGTLGESALVDETDDPMFVVDPDGQVITQNRTAVETLTATPDGSVDATLRDVVGHERDALGEATTVELATVDGTRRYDPQLSTVRDPAGNELATVLSFRDVTDRERRRERLAVLNRVLRHNLRNQVDVIKSHAEALPAAASDRREAICAAGDEMAALGERARRIDRCIEADDTVERVDLTAVVERALDRTADETAVAVTTELPETAVVRTNDRAITSAVESALDNALANADTTVELEVDPTASGYRIGIADDGPGIPEDTLESLRTGEETPLNHTVGLGLWELKWAVTAIRGELRLDTTDGTLVEIRLPGA
jgi:signal transduction histidine kinase